MITSGGGFSNLFPRPSYQNTALSTYWKYHAPPYSSTQMNRGNMRGYPDVAANGVNYIVAVDGGFQYLYGTSASAPVMASIFALVNDVLLSKGKPTIGFANPVLVSRYNDPPALAYNSHELTHVVISTNIHRRSTMSSKAVSRPRFTIHLPFQTK